MLPNDKQNSIQTLTADKFIKPEKLLQIWSNKKFKTWKPTKEKLKKYDLIISNEDRDNYVTILHINKYLQNTFI